MHETGRLIGASFALTGFSVAVVAGLMSHNPALTIVTRAIVVMLVCRALGAFFGYVGERVAVDAVAAAGLRGQGSDSADSVEITNESASAGVGSRRAA